MRSRLFLFGCVACLSLAIGIIPASAQQMPKGPSVEQRQKLERYMLDYIKVLRVVETQPQPQMVEEFNEKYTELCNKRAEEE